MVTLGVTSMLDPFVEGWAKEAGMDTGQLASMMGSNIIGGVVKIPIDTFFTELGGKVVSGLIGLASLLLGTYSLKGQGRLQLDSMQFGSRMVTEILDPTPQQVKEIQQNVGDFFDGWIQGRLDKVAYAFIRNPRETAGLLTGQPSHEKKAETREQTSTERPQPPQTAGIVYRL